MILVPCNNWNNIPEETIGEIPNSIKVPLLEANIILNQNNGSLESLDAIPYNGISDITKNINKVMMVHITRCWN